MKISVNGAVYDFEYESVTNGEAIALEDQAGITFVELGDLLKRGSVKAMTGLAWIAMRRVEPNLAFADVDFKVAEMTIEDAAPLEAADASSDAVTEPTSLSTSESSETPIGTI